MGNLEFRLTAGGADQATEGQTVYGSQNGTKYASNAFDANETTTFWNTQKANVADAWIGQDFGSAVEITEIEIGARVDGNNYDQTPHYFQVWHSDDGTNWTSILTVENESAWSSGEQRVYTVQ